MADRVVEYVFQGDLRGLTTSLTAAGASVRKLGTDLTALDNDGAKARLEVVANAREARKWADA